MSRSTRLVEENVAKSPGVDLFAFTPTYDFFTSRLSIQKKWVVGRIKREEPSMPSLELGERT